MQLATKLVSTRRGTLIAALLIALLAGASILLYLNSYRDSLKAQGALVTVLVAKQTIPKGTSGSVVASKDLYTVTTIRESQLLEGAMSDPATLRDKVATREIFEGAQLTATDFGAAGDSLAAQLTDRQRVVSVPLDCGPRPDRRDRARQPRRHLRRLQRDPARRQTGNRSAGGQARPMLRLILSDVPVVAIGEKASGSGTTNVSLEVDDVKAAKLAFASDNGKVWLALRPSAGAKASRPGIVTVETMLLGVPPVQVLQVRRGPAVNSRGFHVYAALEASLGLDAIREALPAGTPLRAVSLAEAGRSGSEIQQGADLVIVGCSQAHDQALEVISAANAQRADRPVVVLYHGSPNGFLERAFEAGADDLVVAAPVVGSARLRVREGAGAAAAARSRPRPRAR